MSQKKRTRIVCTIGPASHDAETIGKMVDAGMNVARLNFSHGTYEDHAELIQIIRTVAEEKHVIIAILQDLQGPKVRTGDLPKEGVELVVGETIILSSDADAKLPKISVTHDKLHEDVKVGDIFLLDDGLMKLEVTHIADRDISCIVIDGGTLTSHKGVNLPSATLSIPAITEKDRADLRFGVEQGVDFVALSFVRNAAEIEELNTLIAGHVKEFGKEDEPRIRVIAKMEKHEAVKHMDEIIAATDAIMVARGDLGIEMPAEEVPLIQKRLIMACLNAAKPVIVATQMLDSMIRNPRPTRAEVSDVANAVIDHTDAVMLSGESATGKYPVEAVETMARIIEETEASAFDDLAPAAVMRTQLDDKAAIAKVSDTLARNVHAKAIVIAATNGDEVRMISRHRPELIIHGMSAEERVVRQMNLSWGVVPILVDADKAGDMDALIEVLRTKKKLKAGDSIVAVNATVDDTHVDVRTIPE